MATVQSSPSALRNREPILAILKDRLSHGDCDCVLEVASGGGDHAGWFARAMPQIRWRPTDASPDALAAISARREAEPLANLLAPLHLDAQSPLSWPAERADALVCINMVHISPWAATEGLMTGAARVLDPGAMLYLYGPYTEPGLPTVASNVAFDLDLKARNPAWGLRDLDAVTTLASNHGFALTERISMPANNLSLVFRRRKV